MADIAEDYSNVTILKNAAAAAVVRNNRRYGGMVTFQLSRALVRSVGSFDTSRESPVASPSNSDRIIRTPRSRPVTRAFHLTNRSLQVIRSGTRFKLTLEAASADGTGVALTLHDLDGSPVTTGAIGGAVPSCPPGAPAFVRLPLALVTRVRCLAERAGGESNRFVILAARTLSGAQEEDETCLQETVQPLMAREVEPFGILQAMSDKDFCALVLGVASVK